MRGLEEAARRIGARAAVRTRARVAAALRESIGNGVREGDDGVTIEGRGAARRMLGDPALRWVAGLLK